MASVFFYVGGSAAAYWLGSNLFFRSVNASIDWVLNKHASSEIKETHTVSSIRSMLEVYKNLPDSHPAYGAMIQVKDGLQDLQTAIERARLKYEAHKGGYITRFRTFDASEDNVIIERKASDLMTRLDLFTSLMKLPPTKSE
jgi:hypothetical protein